MLKNLNNYRILFILVILSIILYNCGNGDKLDENRKPEGEFLSTTKIKDNLYYERYDSHSLERIELFLTDSINFRLYLLSYSFEDGYRYKVITDSKKVEFYLKCPKEENYELVKEAEYTFYELKKKYNLRKK